MQDVKFDRGGVQNYVSPSEKPYKPKSLDELIQTCPKNEVIGNNLIKAWTIINKDRYKKILCSISGGSDSDVILDIVWKCDQHNKVDYVWFDTGLEYQATKDHLKYLESKYGIEIIRHKAIKPIPVSCKEYGQPFISKHVSEMIYRLQKHGFQWEDLPYETLMNKYENCKVALQWWCDAHTQTDYFNIRRNRFLKEFMILNPPNFKIGSKCCDYAKKNISHNLIKKEHYDLNIIGVRKYENGIRSAKYKSCFEEYVLCDNYRPIFWYTNDDKQKYVEYYHIIHSDCYTKYGFRRTGCCCCPYEKNIDFELDITKTYEPKLYKAVNNIFKESFEYTRKYREFVAEMKQKEKAEKKLKKQNS